MNGNGDLRKLFMMWKKQLARKSCSRIVEVLKVFVVTLNDTRSTRPTFEVLEKLGERSFGEVGRTVCQCHGLDVSSASSLGLTSD